MKLIHYLKSGEHEIPLDGVAALLPSAFRTLLKKKKSTVTHEGFAWHLQVSPTYEGKYKGHQFALVIEPSEIDAAIAALQQHKQRLLAGDPAALVQTAPLPIGVD